MLEILEKLEMLRREETVDAGKAEENEDKMEQNIEILVYSASTALI